MYQSNLLNLIYLYVYTRMLSARHSWELKRNRGARKSVQECVFLSCWSHQPVLSPALFPSVKLNLSSSFTHIQISSMRTWRWGQTVRVTRRRGLPPMRCSLPRVFAWGTEEVGGSLQRWALHCPCIAFLLFKLRTCGIWSNMAAINKCWRCCGNESWHLFLTGYSLHFEGMVWLSKQM